MQWWKVSSYSHSTCQKTPNLDKFLQVNPDSLNLIKQHMNKNKNPHEVKNLKWEFSKVSDSRTIKNVPREIIILNLIDKQMNNLKLRSAEKIKHNITTFPNWRSTHFHFESVSHGEQTQFRKSNKTHYESNFEKSEVPIIFHNQESIWVPRKWGNEKLRNVMNRLDSQSKQNLHSIYPLSKITWRWKLMYTKLLIYVFTGSKGEITNWSRKE